VEFAPRRTANSGMSATGSGPTGESLPIGGGLLDAVDRNQIHWRFARFHSASSSSTGRPGRRIDGGHIKSQGIFTRRLAVDRAHRGDHQSSPEKGFLHTNIGAAFRVDVTQDPGHSLPDLKPTKRSHLRPHSVLSRRSRTARMVSAMLSLGPMCPAPVQPASWLYGFICRLPASYRKAYPPRSPAGRSLCTERESAHELGRHPAVAALISRLRQESVQAAADIIRSHEQRVRTNRLAVDLFVDAAQDIAVARAARRPVNSKVTAFQAPSPIETASPTSDPATQAISSDAPQSPASRPQPLSASDAPQAAGRWIFEPVPGTFPPRKRRRWIPGAQE
jgi:hypothetical protein